MSWRRGRSLNIFGLAFLDVVCCGFGAALLLFIFVNQRSTERLQDLSEVLDSAERELADRRSAAVASEQFTTLVNAVSRGLPPASLRDPVWESAESVVIVLDVSGSMSRYLPDEPVFASEPIWKSRAGVKWGDTASMLAEALLAIPRLERFAIVQLCDDLRGRTPGSPIWPPSDSGQAWAEANETQIRQALDAVRQMTPSGGSNHFAALDALFRRVPSMAPRPDTIILVTDGLPNHGPVARQEPVDARVRPDSGEIEFASREERKVRVVGLVQERLRQLEQSRQDVPVVHCLLVPWPDDPGLVRFALELAAPTGGRVISFPVPGRANDWAARE